VLRRTQPYRKRGAGETESQEVAADKVKDDSLPGMIAALKKKFTNRSK